MKNSKYILLIGILVALSTLLSIFFYQRNATAMQAEVENVFVRILASELRKNLEKLNLSHLSWSTSDTIPLTVRIATAEGVKTYKVDAEKSRKNISQHLLERSLHSVVWIKSPLSLDTLNRLWADTLHMLKVDAKTMIRVSMITLHADTLTSASTGDNNRFTFSSRFASYIGNRCEIEVTGFWEHSWWVVCLYHWPPFLWILIGALLLFFLSRTFYQLMHRPAKIEIVREEVICEVIKEVTHEIIVEKEVICEVIREVSVPIFVKELDDVKLNIYKLRPDLLFDSRKQILVLNGENKALAPQSCFILKIFLDAPNYTLTDTEILEKLWGKRGGTMKDFTAAYARLQKSLNKVGLSVVFKRVENEQYRFIIR